VKPEELHLIVPGPIDQRTGGYLYDAHMATGLELLGWTVVVHSLDGDFPGGDDRAEASLTGVLAGLPGGTRVLLDGLAMGALPGPVVAHATRLRMLGLVHHALADETGLDEARRDRLAALEREALSACLGVLCTSAFTATRMEDYGVPPARVRAVLPGTEPARPALGPPAGEAPRLLCVGAVVPRKGQDVLVRALARLRHIRWSCVCAGSLDRAPAYASTVRELADEEELADRVEFTGECGQAALDNLYHSASLFVLPSHHEGYGMALTEALARGLPIVSTTGGAVPHTVPAAAAILVTPGDEAALTDALGHLLAGPAGASRRARMAAAARTHALTLPTWDRAASAFARAILELSPIE
jgi:glycosyltransferase involved in cell wall biosynthesis